MKFEDTILLIKQELERAKKLHPVWPKDKIHAAAVVSEESGELVQACNDYEGCDPIKDVNIREHYNKMETEAVHTATMAIRFLINM